MNNKFTQWGQLFECKTLKGNQRIILGIILNLHNIEGWDFTPLSVLEERSGFTRPTIIKNLNVLVSKGLLNKLMNKSRQTNGIPPNDYVPIYDNIHNLLNSQRLKNFTFSQQEELKNFTSKRLKNFTKEEKKRKKDIVKRVKENIKEKRESNEVINGKLNRKDEIKEKQSNNNMNFNKNGIYMELNSHPAVQSKDWTKETQEEKTHSSSAGTTKVIQIGDTRYAVETANTDYSSIWDSFPGGTASRENKKVPNEHIIDAIMRGAFLTKSTVPYADIGVWMNPVTRIEMGYEEGENVKVLRDNFVEGPIVYQRGVKTTSYQIGNQVVNEVVEDLNMPTDVIVIGPKNDIAYNCWDNAQFELDKYIQETWGKSKPPAIQDLSIPDELITKLDLSQRITYGSPTLRDGRMASYSNGNRIRHPENKLPLAMHEMGALFTEYPYCYTVVKLRRPIFEITTV